MKFSLNFCFFILITSSIYAQSAAEWYAKGVEASSHTQKITYFTKAIKSDAAFVEAYNARANVHFAMGMVHEAIQDFSQSIRIDSSRVFTFYSRASCLLALQDYAAAAEDFNKVLQLQPEHVYAMSGKGCALMLQGQNEAAVAVLEEALAMDASVQSAVQCRNQALKKMGKPVAIPVSQKKEMPIVVNEVASDSKLFKVKAATSLRAEATHTARTLLRFDAGNKVELLEKTDAFWWKVRYKGKIGYAKAALLEVLP